MELLHDVVPGLSHAAVLVDAASPAQAVGWNEIRTAADQLGLQADRIDLQSADDLEAAFEAIVSGRADAFVDAQNPLLLPVRERFAALAQQHHLPGIVALREYVVSGLLMSYTPNFLAIHRRAAVLVDKILKGAKPADLPVEQPNTVDLVVNVKTLQALGLTIPSDVAIQVTDWIQ